MLLAQSRSSDPNPIVPASSEAIWSVVSIGILLIAVVLLVLLIRWASVHLGSEIGTLKRGVRDR